MESHRDILEEIAEIAGAMAEPSSVCGPPGLIPSPRGIQDSLANALNQARSTCCSGTGCNAKAETLEMNNGHDVCCQANVPRNVPCHSNVVGQGDQPIFSLQVPQPRYADAITPWIEEGKPPAAYYQASLPATLPQTTSLLSPSTPTTADEFEEFDSFGSNSTASSRGRRLDPPMVMPPTAKSILERRERAIREGRRHEAKLSSEERRIVRRLRNRESAERCAKRKTEEAEQMSRRIACLEEENQTLRMLASEYEAEISSIESSLVQNQCDDTGKSISV